MKASRSAAVGWGGGGWRGGGGAFSLDTPLPWPLPWWPGPCSLAGERPVAWPARRRAEPPGLAGTLLGAEVGAEWGGGGGTWLGLGLG